MRVSRLALGTVQFGLAYGISNRRGQVAQEALMAILTQARSSGIDMIDTASAYGDSEAAIGQALPIVEGPFLIVTKTPSFGGQGIGNAEINALRSTFDRSLQRLGVNSVYGLLVHDVRDWLGAGGEHLRNFADEIKASGKAAKIGVSIYEPWEADAALERAPFDIVQLPLNVLDQRFIHSGALRRLNATGIEIHCRSIFLQGLLLMPIEDIPLHLGELRPMIGEFHHAAETAGVPTLAAALAFARGVAEIDRIVVGVTSPQELSAIAAAFNATTPVAIDFQPFAANHLRAIDPRYWASTQS